MQNPLENFLLNLAEKIQTEKEYKDIVKDSQNVDVNKDVFAGFIDGISKTIRENVQTPSLSALQEKQDPLDNFLLSLGETLKNIPEKKKEDVSQPVLENEPVANDLEQKIEKEKEEPDAFAGFVNNLANILKKEPDPQPVKQEQEQEQEPVQDYVNILSSEKKKKEKPPIEKKLEENEEAPDIKKFVTNFVSKELEAFKNDLTEKYLKKAAVLSEYAGGGGTNAVQYANGGVMNGDLNVSNVYPNNATGSIGSPSNRWDKIYANQVDSLSSNIVIELSGFYVDGDFTVNGTISAIGGDSNQWNSNYSTTNSNSANWSSAYTTLCSTSAFRISNTITAALFPNGYTFSSSDTGKTYHVDTRLTPVSVLLPSNIPNDFNVTLVTLGTNNMHVSSSQMPMLCATGTKVNFAFASTFLYKYDDLFWGLGSLI